MPVISVQDTSTDRWSLAEYDRIKRDGPPEVLRRLGRRLVNYSRLAPRTQRVIPTPLVEQLVASEPNRLGYWPDITSPVTFNEKIIHRKLFGDQEQLALLEDKIANRERVRERVGDEYLITLYHVSDDPDTIPFEELPNTFVLKAGHGSGLVEVIGPNDDPDPDQLRNRCHKWLASDYGRRTNERFYDRIPRRILVEERLENSDGPVPVDIKCFVFHGRVSHFGVISDRFDGPRARIYDRTWTPLPVEYGYPLAPPIDKPQALDELIKVAEAVAGDLDHLRVDMYHPQPDRVVVGELTPTTGAGWNGFEPQSFDRYLGTKW